MSPPGGSADPPVSKAPVSKAPSARSGPAKGGGLSKSELAYEAIRNRIANGTYGSGYRLVLDQLAQELSVSPVPVREAIRRLEAEGYVLFKRNVGAQVASIDVAEYAQVMQVLAVLEAAATALSLPFLDAADLARARAVNEAMKASFAGFDPVEFTRLNREFHGIMYARCPNAHLREFIGREWKRMDAIRRSTFSFVPERARDAVKEHDQLIDLIESKQDASQVESFCRSHRTATADAFQIWHQTHSGS